MIFETEAGASIIDPPWVWVENASTRYTLERINEMITHQRKNYDWEFMFLAANQDAIATVAKMGIARDMASVSELSAKGMTSAHYAFSRKMKSMRKKSRTGEEDEDFHKPMEDVVKEEEEKD